MCACTNRVIVVREEHGFRALPWVLVPEVEEATGGWRKLHNMKLRVLYYSQNIIR